MNRRIVPLGIAVLMILGGVLVVRLTRSGAGTEDAGRYGGVGCSEAGRAYLQRQSGLWLTVSSQVMRTLPDEIGTLKHQRFIVRCSSGQTLLIVNDLSIGTRAPVHVGDRVLIRGQYVWNRQGGLLHFTHHSDSGGAGGWIVLRGRVYSLGRPGDGAAEHEILAKGFKRGVDETEGPANALDAEVADRGHAGADELGRDNNNHSVCKPAAQHRSDDFCSSLDQQRSDAQRGQLL